MAHPEGPKQEVFLGALVRTVSDWKVLMLGVAGIVAIMGSMGMPADFAEAMMNNAEGAGSGESDADGGKDESENDREEGDCPNNPFGGSHSFTAYLGEKGGKKVFMCAYHCGLAKEM